MASVKYIVRIKFHPFFLFCYLTAEGARVEMGLSMSDAQVLSPTPERRGKEGKGGEEEDENRKGEEGGGERRGVKYKMGKRETREG